MGRIIPGLLALVWTTVASAATSLHFGPPPQWVRATPIPAPGATTSASTKVLLVDEQIELSRRAVSYYLENVVQIQTPQGLSAMGTVKVDWDPDTDVLIIHKVHILRGDKVIDVLGAGQTFTIARREVNLDYAAIDDTLTAILEPSDLEVGDTLDVAYTLQRTDPILAGTSEAVVALPPEELVTAAHVSALWPKSDLVKWQATQEFAGLHPIHTAGMAGIELTLTDLQPIVQPKDAPPRFLIERRVDLSSFGSWAEVGRRMAPLYQQAAMLSGLSPLQAQIAAIRAASADPKVRAAMALKLVQDKVRYVFLDMNEGGLVPASADLTWSRRYGDCKAKTVLLLALLHGLGIEAQPVAVNMFHGDGIDARLPMIELFDHVLVRAAIGGQTYWLDGTGTGDDSLDQLHEPFYHWGLPLVPSGAQLTQMLPPPLTQPSLEASVEVDATGGVAAPAPVHAQTVIRGMTGVMLKTGLGNMTPTQLDTALRQIWEHAATDVKVRSVAASYDTQADAERLTMDGTVTMDFSGGWHRLSFLNVGSKVDFKRDPGPNQDAPYAVPYPTFMRSTEVIKLPANGKGFGIMGGDTDLTLAATEFHRHANIAGGVLTATVTARSIMPEFPASEAVADQKGLRKLEDSGIDLVAPKGHVATAAEIAWGLPSSNSTADSYAQSGYDLYRHGEHDAAMADYDAALALDSHDTLALGNRGITYFWNNDKAQARADFDAALALDPHAWVALNGRGLLAFYAGDEAGAITAFTAAFGSNPKDYFALSMRAQAYWRAGKQDEALADFSAEIRQAPKANVLYGYRAALLRQEGRKAEALRQARLVTTANPKSAPAYLTAGEIYNSYGESTPARAAFEHAAALAPVPHTYLVRAGDRLWTDLAGKRADVEKALQLDPKSAPALAMLAEVQMAAGQYTEAAASLTQAMDDTAATSGALVLRGIAYQKAGRTALAQADFAGALAKAKLPGELNNLCWALATANVSLASALDDCNAALVKDPTSTAALDSRGFVLLRLGRYDEAIASYDSALKLNPLVADSLYGRGLAELRAGRESRGQADLKGATVLSFTVADEFAHYGLRP
ncbi:MAG TPA: tetratricopeptide repeat protein [Steroidobacteraceae bacterium]